LWYRGFEAEKQDFSTLTATPSGRFKMSSADSKLHKASVGPELNPGNDQLAEEILNNMNNTPVGRLLKVISALPEIRQEKVDQIKLELDSGSYKLDQNLDAALDIMLEELMA
jgi:hypothetical protein